MKICFTVMIPIVTHNDTRDCRVHTRVTRIHGGEKYLNCLWCNARGKCHLSGFLMQVLMQVLDVQTFIVHVLPSLKLKFEA
jgi:hypothetical protein